MKNILTLTTLTAIYLFPLASTFAHERPIASDERPSKVSRSTEVSDIHTSSVPLANIEMLRDLETRRDEAYLQDHQTFKDLTNQISNCITQSCSSNQFPSGNSLHLFVNSIIRTRHTFLGQSCLGKHGMINRYIPNFDPNTDFINSPNFSVIIAIDAMAKTALDDEDFSNLWAQQGLSYQTTDGHTENGWIFEEFVTTIINHIKSKHFGWSDAQVATCVKAVEKHIYEHPGLVRLAGDIFDLYAPKLNLLKVYSNLLVSGETYKGWEIDGLNNWAQVIRLTEEEKQRYPNKEGQLRDLFNKKMLSSPESLPVYSTSAKAVKTTSTKAIITYCYDPCLKTRGFDVEGLGPLSFSLQRDVSSSLAHLLSPSGAVTSDLNMTALYHTFTKSLLSNTQTTISNETVNEGLKQGNWRSFLPRSQQLFYGKGIAKNQPLSIQLLREANYLSSAEFAKIILMKCLTLYANALRDENLAIQDLPAAIEFYQEALDLSPNKTNEVFKTLQKSLAETLNKYAINLRYGRDNTAKDIPHAIQCQKEAINVYPDKTDEKFKNMQKTLANVLHCYAEFDLGVSDNTIQDLPSALDAYQTAFDIYPDKDDDYPAVIAAGLIKLLDLQIGILGNDPILDLPRIIEVHKKLHDLSPCPKVNNALITYLNIYAAKLQIGFNDIKKDLPRAIEVSKEAKEVIDFHKEEAGAFYKIEIDFVNAQLIYSLRAYGHDLCNGNDVEKDLPRAIELYQEALDLCADKSPEFREPIELELMNAKALLASE